MGSGGRATRGEGWWRRRGRRRRRRRRRGWQSWGARTLVWALFPSWLSAGHPLDSQSGCWQAGIEDTFESQKVQQR